MEECDKEWDEDEERREEPSGAFKCASFAQVINPLLKLHHLMWEKQ